MASGLQFNRTEGQGNTMTMTKAQFIALPEYRAWQAAYGRWLRGNGAHREECAALYAAIEAKFRELFSIANNVPVYDLCMVPDGDYTVSDRPWYTWHLIPGGCANL